MLPYCPKEDLITGPLCYNGQGQVQDATGLFNLKLSRSQILTSNSDQ